MHIIRYAAAGGPPSIGVTDGSGAVRPLPVASLAELLALPLADIRAAVQEAAHGSAVDGPVGRSRRWTAGPRCGRPASPTGAPARRAIEESSERRRLRAGVRRRTAGAVLQVGRVAGASADGEPSASAPTPPGRPEPELAVVVNRGGEIVGYTVCNDVSSRSIEGENPLYLPQAKVYAARARSARASGRLGDCRPDRPGDRVHDHPRRRGGLGGHLQHRAAAPAPRRPGRATCSGRCTSRTASCCPPAPAWCPASYRASIERGRRADQPAVAWSATTSTALLHRRLDDLVEHLFRAMHFPHGVILSTGTGIVPGLDLSLTEGDIVRIEIEGVGVLTNPVRQVPA